ncbi:hypothetical protein [Roseobacter sp.]|uniref:hypothetical protein n=1 Tax=Roseobacter sp. TaxID=1907202 RepID=UPI00385D91E8
MFDFLKKTSLAATVSLAAFVVSGTVVAGTGVSNIDVQAKLEAPQDSNALDLYPTIEGDLTRAILERVNTTNDPAGPTISIKIKRVSLDGDTILPDSAEFNELEGFLSYQGGSREVVETIKLSAYADTQSVPDGYISVPPSNEDFYQAMLTTFADRVIELVPEEDVSSGS